MENPQARPYLTRKWARSLATSAAVLLVSGVAARLTSAFIGIRFPERPRPPDLLFEILPYVPWTQYLTDVAVYSAIALLAYYALRERMRDLPTMIALFGVMQFLRALVNVLTPLAGPLGNGAFYGFIHMTQNGEFPSGHVGSVMLCFLLVDREEAPRLRVVMAVLLVVEGLSLLLSHGHYSIDVVGGFLLSYFVYHALGQPLKRLFAGE